MTPLIWLILDWLVTGILFAVTVVLARINLSIQRKREILGELPCYKGYLPLIGHAHLAFNLTYPGFIDMLIKSRSENKGSVQIWAGPKLSGYISNPADIQKVLNRKDALNKGDLFNFYQAHSVGLLSNTTPRWYKMRRLASTPLTNLQMIDSLQPVFQQQAGVLLQILSTVEGGHSFTDIYPYLSRCCQDITYESHFGVKLGIQRNLELCAQESVAQSIALINERMMKVWLYPDFIYFRTDKGKMLSKHVNHNQSVARKIISERRKILQCGKHNEEETEFDKKTKKLLDVYFQHGLSDEEIVHEIMDIMLAGFETMSLTQSWVLLLLSMFPIHQEKVRNELDQVLGDSEDISLADLQRCQYLDMVTKEALRLFGLPVVIRRLGSDVSLEIKNYTLPAEAEIIIAMCLVHRDARYWDHPDQFYPDHFLPEKVAGRPKYAFLPFGGGPRKCPAYAYGLVVVKFIVATLLRKYTFTTKQDFNNLPLDLFFMYKPTDGFLLNFQPREFLI
ncbi:cytochrome P450 4c3-like [Homalodisca vitripennis]|uniref:cytochrome P450 4c3-like n=1 Tax=Homalodisca vitripennis TaxID=197043 RepID=UPI001EE9C620|nr:cytochrome P450 4c3-like [Homalodisca vitripennis]